MEYEVLSDKDKGFVREVITKVCGSRKLNHSRYRSAVDYLKDVNAVSNFIGLIKLINLKLVVLKS